MRHTIPFIGGDYRSKSISVNDQETVNLIVQKQGQDAKSPYVLQSSPGTLKRIVIPSGKCRTPKMVNWKGSLYGVFGTKLFRIDSGFVITDIGSLTTSTGVCHISRGRNYIHIVDGEEGYTYDGTTFLQISDLDYPSNATHTTYMDGFFIANDAETDNFYISALEDPASWNALDFEAASVAPDNALAIANTESVLYIFGDETVQPYYNSGDSDFPYSAYLNGTQEVGISAPHSVAESDNGIFFLATTPEGGLFVYRLNGIQGSIVTENEQSDELAKWSTPEKAFGFIYTRGRQSFYVLQDAARTRTLIYNIDSGMWTSRESAEGGGWFAAGHGSLGLQNIVGSLDDGSIFTLEDDIYTDDSKPLIRRRKSQIYHNHGMSMEWWELVVDFEPGVGLVLGQGSDPQCLMRYSDDSGYTWSNWLQSPIGKVGEFKTQASFRRLGNSRHRVYEIAVSDPVPVTIKAAYAVLEVLRD